MINFKCRKCGELLEAPESLAGEAIKCPKCGSSVIAANHAILIPSKTAKPLPGSDVKKPRKNSAGGILGGVMILIGIGFGLSLSLLVGALLFVAGFVLMILDQIVDQHKTIAYYNLIQCELLQAIYKNSEKEK